LNVYRECPLKAKYKFIDKIPEPSSPALENGSKIHKEAERYMNVGGRLPVSLKLLKDKFKAIKAIKDGEISTELQWAFTKTWQPTDWFGRDAWCRTVLDLFAVFDNEDKTGLDALVVDYKTGKVYPKDEEQLTLYAVGTFMKHAAVDRVTTQLWYTKTGHVIGHEYTRKDLKKLQNYWVKESRKLLADTQFKPMPSNGCRWCNFGSNGIKVCQY
jgi:CRISPR/Cas system-associated exonuclease Cas4 (RecB family)